MPDLVEHVGHVDLREDQRPLVHVVLGEDVCLEQLEPLAVQREDVSDLQVALAVELAGLGVFVFPPVQVLALLDPRVPLGDQVNLYAVVAAEEREDERPAVVFLVLADHSDLES